MTDIEDRILAYRPAGPPDALRARSVEDARAVRPASAAFLRWIPAMSAAAAAVLLALLASRARANIAVRVGSVQTDGVVPALASALGGGDLAHAEAERIVRDVETAQPPRPDETFGAPEEEIGRD